MKIKIEDSFYCLPVSSGLHLLYDYSETNELIECLSSYFGQKKKTKCVILDDEGDLIPPKDYEFIYFSSKDLVGTFEFGTKSHLNTELSSFIETNPEMFSTLDNIRNEIKSMLSDVGINRFRKILSFGLANLIEIDTSNFDVSKIIANYSIDNDNLSFQEQMMILYNLYLYIFKERNKIVYIDFEVDNLCLDWLKAITSDNTIILVNNISVPNNYSSYFDSLMSVNKGREYEVLTLPINHAPEVSYLFHPVVLRNMGYQSTKIIDLSKLFGDFASTFKIVFSIKQLS